MTIKSVTNRAQGPRVVNAVTGKAGEGKDVITQVALLPGETADLDLPNLEDRVLKGMVGSGDLVLGEKGTVPPTVAEKAERDAQALSDAQAQIAALQRTLSDADAAIAEARSKASDATSRADQAEQAQRDAEASRQTAEAAKTDAEKERDDLRAQLDAATAPDATKAKGGSK